MIRQRFVEAKARGVPNQYSDLWAGGYKFLDVTRVGFPLNQPLAIVTPFYIYLGWGL